MVGPYTTTPDTVGRGFAEAGDPHPKVAVRFDTGTFEELRQMALTSNTSLAEQVRRCVERGLQTA